MITKPVTFVLGAGASYDYGFPLGRELLDEALRVPEGTSNFSTAHNPGIYDQIELRRFQRALQQSTRMSVDAFLEHRPEFIDVGKRVIAYLLAQREDPTKLYPPDGPKNHWYQYLLKLMLDDCDAEKFSENKVRIISFNYDRSLAYYFLAGLSSAYNLSWPEAARLLNSVRITHVHGTLGKLIIPNTTSNVSDGRLYDPNLRGNGLHIAAESIKIIHEVEQEDKAFAEAHRILQDSEVVAFLGFGYDKRNIERLKLHENCPAAHICGTTVGLTPDELKYQIEPVLNLKRRVFKPPFTGADKSIIDFLRNNLRIFYEKGLGSN